MPDKKKRDALKIAFEAGAKPSGTDFANLIDSVLNSVDDGIEKPSGISQPLKILPQGNEQNLLDFGGAEGEASWRINRKPGNAQPGLNFSLNDSSKLFIENDTGRVGVGTTSPKSLLHITQDLCIGKDENNARFIFHSRASNSGDFLLITHDKANGNWEWGHGITLRRNGNVGIGTTLPDCKLHVDGAIKSTDGIIFSDNSTQKAVIIDTGEQLANESTFKNDADAKSGSRHKDYPVVFNEKFSRPPKVITSFFKLDAVSDKNLRVFCRAMNITANGFDLQFSVWSDSKVYEAKISWIAFGS